MSPRVAAALVGVLVLILGAEVEAPMHREPLPGFDRQRIPHNLLRLCEIVDCSPMPPAPRITEVRETATPSGELLVVGEDFGAAAGQLLLLLGAREYPLDIMEWWDSGAIGRVPGDITGVPDSLAAIRVVTRDRRRSNLFEVQFVARREVRLLPSRSLSGTCSPGSDHNDCFQLTPDWTVAAYHWNHQSLFYCFDGDSGADAYSISLRNGWVVHSVEDPWVYHGTGRAQFGRVGGLSGVPLRGSNRMYFSVAWSNGCGLDDGVFYVVSILIAGPEGLPH